MQKLASLQPLEHNPQAFRRASGTDFGIGMHRSFRIPDMFGGTFTLGLVGFIINLAFLKIEQHFLRWHGTSVET